MKQEVTEVITALSNNKAHGKDESAPELSHDKVGMN